MKRVLIWLIIFCTAVGIFACAPNVSWARESAPKIRIAVELKQPTNFNPCDIVIEAVDDAPLPMVNVLRMASNTTDSFDIMSMAPGVYSYKVYQVPGKDKHVIYDKTVYIVNVTVSLDGNGKTSVDVVAHADRQNTKSSIIFENRLKEDLQLQRKLVPKTSDIFPNFYEICSICSLGLIGLIRGIKRA